MARYKVEIHSKTNWDALYNLNNKLVMDNSANGMMIFRDVKHIEEEETYGRRKNKTRTKYFIECELLGYNRNAKLIGAFDENTLKRILMFNDVYKMRRLYLDHIEALEVMQAKESNIQLEAEYGSVWMAECIKAVEEGKTLKAVKIYKDNTGKTLKEAKDFVLNELKPKYYIDPEETAGDIMYG